MERILRSGPVRILCDSRLGIEPEPHWFEPDWWQGRDAVTAELGGRGQALALATPLGEAVLRRYLRGGMVRHFSRERYLYTGLHRSRPFREWRVTRTLFDAGLPVPEPLAAALWQRGAFYSAALLTRRIGDAEPLHRSNPIERAAWQELGRTIGRFARAGLSHSDLNATNILIDPHGRFHLIDFDRARIVARLTDPQPMLARLARSLEKLGIAHDADALRDGATESNNSTNTRRTQR